MQGKWIVLSMLSLGIAMASFASWRAYEQGKQPPRSFKGREFDLGRRALEQNCSSCHYAPEPSDLPSAHWADVLRHMTPIMKERADIDLPEKQAEELLYWFEREAPETLEALPPDVIDGPLRFEPAVAGAPAEDYTAITHVSAVDLNGDGRPEALVSDAGRDRVIHMTWEDGRWWESDLAELPDPARQCVVDYDGDGDLDIVVAVLGSLAPTDDAVGSVALLRNDGKGGYATETLLSDVGRVADVRPADFDGDGDMDLAVAIFGFHKIGMVGWLEQTPDGTRLRSVIEKTGAVDVRIADLNGDGAPDIVALLSQESEEITACLNDGRGRFQQVPLFKARTPLWGSSGIQLVDFDQDGDIDVLYSNGDAMDAVSLAAVRRPYHGVQWLENKGGMVFEMRELRRWYGVYDAQAVDLDGDGDLDVVCASMFNDWEDETRCSLMWLENDGAMNFAMHGITTSPTHLITVAAADFTGNGNIDLLAGGLHLYPPYTRKGRVTFFQIVK